MVCGWMVECRRWLDFACHPQEIDPMNLPSNPLEMAFAATIVAAVASWISFVVYSLRHFVRFGPRIRPADWSKGAAPLIRGMLLSALAFALLTALGAILQSRLGG